MEGEQLGKERDGSLNTYDNMRTCGQALENDSGRCRARGECKSIFGVLNSGYSLLEIVAVRVGRTAIFVNADWLADCSLGKGSTERNRFDDSSGDGIMRRSCMDCEGAEAMDWRGSSWRSLNAMILGHLDGD